MPRTLAIGGYNRPGVPRPGPFIRDTLSGGPSWAHAIYKEYKAAAQAVPLREKGRHKRHACSYNSFQHYILWLLKLGWIEYVQDTTGAKVTQQADGKSQTGSLPPAPRVLIQLAPGAAGHDWNAFQQEYRATVGP